MIKVIYDHQIFGLQQYGGISRYFFELARRVGKYEGFSASILAPLHINRYLEEGGLHVKGIRIPAIPKTRRFISIANQCVSSGLVRAAKPDLIHETYFQRKARSNQRCPVVVTVYDMIHEKFRSEFSHDSTSDAKRAAVARADRVICISENTRADLINLFGADPGKIKTIHLGFSLTRQADPATLPSYPRPYLLYVGQRSGYKNFRALLSAYAEASRINKDFDLIAFGGEPFSQEEKKAVSNARLDPNRVRRLVGDDSMLGHLYRNAAALVYPSLYEGFGIPPLEAMSFGCPVICSNTSSIPEVVGDGGLYFNPATVESLIEAMERLLNSEELRLQLIARGTRRVANFSYDRCASETVAVYRDAVGK
jgi:glycosyltransferase involved in cell wall biosynthesis